MLLPSAITCGDSSHSPPLTRLQSALFASPPASPPQLSTQTAVGNIFSTCRSLQSLLTSPMPPLNTTVAVAQEPITPPSSFSAQLPTPPLAHAPTPPPLKLRLRSRKTETSGHSATDPKPPARKRIVKRAPAPPARGPNKRRRAVEDDHDNDDSDMEQQEQSHQPNLRSAQVTTTTVKEQQPTEEIEIDDPPHTPKRARIAPEVIPLGLERSDYHNLHHAFPDEEKNNKENTTTTRGTDVVVESDGVEWSTEDDRILVELVLEKLKLSKSEWQDCARSLGKDRSSLGKRWKSLMINGDVGLLKRSGLRRGKIHGTWR
ncbi:hypothetical protein QBC38DRAFT_470966 [Podospora fimiseda]|uniref:Myb-like domain-containing protein n=1 Tax=Podospora fimiseda TaxID=252190 RepID=A0AAN7BV29_9PEZI|nr:hypothetical protein QBC38DRAFT_470966 [Podospora fimiseda]